MPAGNPRCRRDEDEGVRYVQLVFLACWWSCRLSRVCLAFLIVSLAIGIWAILSWTNGREVRFAFELQTRGKQAFRRCRSGEVSNKPARSAASAWPAGSMWACSSQTPPCGFARRGRGTITRKRRRPLPSQGSSPLRRGHSNAGSPSASGVFLRDITNSAEQAHSLDWESS